MGPPYNVVSRMISSFANPADATRPSMSFFLMSPVCEPSFGSFLMHLSLIPQEACRPAHQQASLPRKRIHSTYVKSVGTRLGHHLYKRLSHDGNGGLL
jgi:hypothetical protein